MRARNMKEGCEGKRMLSAVEAAAYCGLGRTQTRQLAENAGAVARYGRRVLFDRIKLDAALDAMTE